MGELFSITVDNREKTPSAEVRVKELAVLNVPATVGHLSVGDYQWLVQAEDSTAHLVVVERKSIQDFLSSAADGRLNRFIEETGGANPPNGMIRALLLEGDQFTFSTHGYKDWTPEQLDNLLVSMQSFGVRVLRSHSVARTAARLKSFWLYSGREDHNSLLKIVPPEVTGNYLSPTKREAIRALMGLPGWGEKVARTALDAVGSVGGVLDAVRTRDYTRFKDVHGIGKGRIDGAANFLEEKHA